MHDECLKMRLVTTVTGASLVVTSALLVVTRSCCTLHSTGTVIAHIIHRLASPAAVGFAVLENRGPMTFGCMIAVFAGIEHACNRSKLNGRTIRGQCQRGDMLFSR